MSEGGRNAPKGIGAVVSIPYGPVAEWLVESGYRWLVVDVEHAPMGPKEQLEVITAGHAGGATVYVRVAAIDERAIGFALDAGADGVIVPDVRTADDAQRAAAACRYPPGGRRSIGPIRRQAASPTCIVQLESVDAIAVADSIALVDGIDAVMVGPGDLALDVGLVPGVDTHHPTMRDFYAQVRAATAATGTPSGTFALMGAGDISQAAASGWDFLVACLDRLALCSAAASL